MIEQEYGIKTKPVSSGNPQANATLERIHQVLGNLVRTYNLQETYVDDSGPWMGTVASSAFAVQITYCHNKQKSACQLVFERDMILPINHIANWRHIHQQKQRQIEK